MSIKTKAYVVLYIFIKIMFNKITKNIIMYVSLMGEYQTYQTKHEIIIKYVAMTRILQI